MPHLPGGVAHLVNDVDVNGYPASIGLWLLIVDAEPADGLYFLGLMGSFQLEVGPALLLCMHSGASFVTCRTTVGGIGQQTYVEPWTTNHGAEGGGQAENVATGFYVQSGSGGRGSGSRIHIPATPDSFIDRNVLLTDHGRGQLQHAADALRTWVSSVTGPTGAEVVLGTLQTRRNGLELVPPTFDPSITVRPTLRVETLGRRLPKRRSVSPPGGP